MFARTRRLTLRPAWAEDARALADAIGHRAVVDRLSNVPWPYRADDADDFIARMSTSVDHFLLILAHEAPTPRLIGGIGLHVLAGQHELGYWLTPSAWGRGYATEAGRQVIEIARDALPLRRLRARHHVDNPASARVLAKLGFRSTGEIAPLPSLARGQAVDSVVLELDLAAPIPTAMPIAA